MDAMGMGLPASSFSFSLLKLFGLFFVAPIAWPLKSLGPSLPLGALFSLLRATVLARRRRKQRQR